MQREASAEHSGISRGAHFASVIQRALTDLLHVAAMIKHPSFQNEQETRFMSPPIAPGDSRICFRPGRSTLIPYVHFELVEKTTAATERDLDRSQPLGSAHSGCCAQSCSTARHRPRSEPRHTLEHPLPGVVAINRPQRGLLVAARLSCLHTPSGPIANAGVVIPASALVEATIDRKLSAKVDCRCYDDSSDYNADYNPLPWSFLRLIHV